MRAITVHVQRSSQEQAHGGKQITRSIESINEMVTHLNRAQKEQTKGSEQVLGAVEAIKAVSDHQTRSVRALEEAIDSLQRQSEVLRAEVRRFKV
jgi:methyl-accepting chemotaxis protein